jgi:flagellar basal body-associated protein FliL
MSTEENKPAADSKSESGEATSSPPRSKKKPLVIGGGSLSMIALGWALSLVALPSKHAEKTPEARGPILLDVSSENGFQVNLSGFGGKNYLAMKVIAEVDALDPAAVTERAHDPLVQAKLSDAVLKTASRKTKADLDEVGKDVFREELRVALEATLFTVQVGDESGEGGRHGVSGLGPGRSIERSTLRGAFEDHVLEVDAPAKTIRLDEGTELTFTGTETDLEVRSSKGDTVYVDVSGLEPDFQGEVHVGMLGSVRNLYFTAFLIQ